jgi:hypothetical protein
MTLKILANAIFLKCVFARKRFDFNGQTPKTLKRSIILMKKLQLLIPSAIEPILLKLAFFLHAQKALVHVDLFAVSE